METAKASQKIAWLFKEEDIIELLDPTWEDIAEEFVKIATIARENFENGGKHTFIKIYYSGRGVIPTGALYCGLINDTRVFPFELSVRRLA